RSVLAFHDLASGMKKLAEELAIKGMYGLGEIAVAADASIVARHQDMRCIAGSVVNAGRLGDDEAGAALGSRLVVCDEALGDMPVMRHRGIVAGRDDA